MKVSVLGYGTVGVGVYEMLRHTPGMEPGQVLVREGKVREPFMTASISDITDDPTVDAVVEVMGGTDAAFEYVSAALQAGKHVVTANKALVAARGPKLAALAEENGCAFLFSAACGGGVPFLLNLSLVAESDEIFSFGGLLNGTTNYILDAMQSSGTSYAEALADAQRLGYAEADPTADVSGLDTLRKIALACAVAYGRLPELGLQCEGITSFKAEDALHIRALNLTCRLTASGGRMKNGAVQAYVQPTLYGVLAPECSVRKNWSLAKLDAHRAGTLVLIGQGAGRWPTAAAIQRDLSDILHGKRRMLSPDCEFCAADNRDAFHSYYVRTNPEFAPGFSAEKIYLTGSVVRFKTKKMPVPEMHRIAERIRKSGGEIFFAAMEE